ncbi:MAG: hypothetical protein JST89_20470 [Cyanobacteria bacterium SZAS-4]|nr:hypothetical protein [Cyanobacteria bacterium SZAS-4]
MTKQTLLFLGASPVGEGPLNLTYELSKLKETISEAPNSANAQIESELGVSANQFTKHVIRYRPKFLHLGFHGDIDAIYFRSEVDGTAQKVPMEAWRHLGDACKNSVKIMTLSCCNSIDIARELAASIDFVIGMNSEISNQAVSDFSAAFYSAIWSGYTVRESFDFGIAQIAASDGMEQDIPELVTNKDASTAVIFPNFVFGNLRFSGSALNATVETTEAVREIRAHHIGSKGIKANFDLTNLLSPDIKIEKLFVEVDEYNNHPCLDAYIYYALVMSFRRYKCELKPRTGRYYCIQTDNNYDYLRLSCDELESFVVELTSKSTGLYKFRVGLTYSQGGITRVCQ